jgi:LPXTG-motif cell wall-anchored protein
MRNPTRTLFAGLAALVAGLVGPLAAAAPAAATTPTPPAPVCKTATTHMYARPDSGNHGDWALDGIKDSNPADLLTRTVTICEQAPVVLHVNADTVTKPRSLYTATVADEGAFTTLAGHSPNAGVTLPAGITGRMAGSGKDNVAFTASFTAESGFANYKATYAGDTYHGSAPSSSGDWVKNLWGGKDFEQVTNLVGWSWDYWTCNKDRAKATEKWVDAETNKAGSIPSAGDITGKKCPSPSPSPSAVSSSKPAGGTGGGGSPSSSASTGGGSLPVTGSNAMIGAGVGAGLLLVGVVAVLWARRRRNIQFTA